MKEYQKKGDCLKFQRMVGAFPCVCQLLHHVGRVPHHCCIFIQSRRCEITLDFCWPACFTYVFKSKCSVSGPQLQQTRTNMVYCSTEQYFYFHSLLKTIWCIDCSWMWLFIVANYSNIDTWFISFLIQISFFLKKGRNQNKAGQFKTYFLHICFLDFIFNSLQLLVIYSVVTI